MTYFDVFVFSLNSVLFISTLFEPSNFCDKCSRYCLSSIKDTIYSSFSYLSNR